MHILSFLSPLTRRVWTFWTTFVILGGILLGLSYLIPEYHKTTIFFSIKTVSSSALPSTPQLSSMDPVESASKVAEMIAGWAQNPGFRNQVLDNAELFIPRFKHKLSARRQNRLNVFWTLKLLPDEAVHAETLTTALLSVFQKNFSDFNTDNTYPFGVSTPSVYTETSDIPFLWRVLGVSILSFLFTVVGLYAFEVFRDRISFLEQVSEIFPETPILRVQESLGTQNPKLLEQFILTFESPRLIATFPGAEKFFQLAPVDAIDEEIDTPVLLIKLGQTHQAELENLLAIFGDEIGIIVFEKG